VQFFFFLSMPPTIRAATDPARTELWETKRLRNRALLHALAETGGRVSEILSLNADTFSGNWRGKSETLHLTVMGKGGHQHILHLHEALPAIYDYLKARDTNTEWRSSVPLFISHDPRYRGSRMSRIVAWRVVHRAAKTLGLPDISPQDFRHWRALQLINAGYTPEQVQEYLGHRSVETIRSFYLAGEEEQESAD
jgi:site-specific recombinase XerD